MMCDIVFSCNGEFDYEFYKFETEEEIISMIDYLKGIQEYDEKQKLIKSFRDKFGEDTIGAPYDLRYTDYNFDAKYNIGNDDDDEIINLGYVNFKVILMEIKDCNRFFGSIDFYIEDEDIRNNIISYLEGVEAIFK